MSSRNRLYVLASCEVRLYRLVSEGAVWLWKGSVVSLRAFCTVLLRSVFLPMRSPCVISRPVCSMHSVAVCLSWWRALRCRNNPQPPTPGFMLVSLRGHSYSHRTPREGLNPSSRWLLPSASALRDLTEGRPVIYFLCSQCS